MYEAAGPAGPIFLGRSLFSIGEDFEKKKSYEGFFFLVFFFIFSFLTLVLGGEETIFSPSLESHSFKLTFRENWMKPKRKGGGEES